MSTQATGTFTIDTWESEPYDEQDGVQLARTRVTKTFHGEIVGQSTAELLMASAQEGSAAYVGFERIVGRVHDHSGSFVLHHSATTSHGAQSASWSVVPDSGTGDLRRFARSGGRTRAGPAALDPTPKQRVAPSVRGGVHRASARCAFPNLGNAWNLRLNAARTARCPIVHDTSPPCAARRGY